MYNLLVFHLHIHFIVFVRLARMRCQVLSGLIFVVKWLVEAYKYLPELVTVSEIIKFVGRVPANKFAKLY